MREYNNLIKIEWSEFHNNHLLMEGGNPFHQVFRGSFEECLMVMTGYLAVGYVDVTSSESRRKHIQDCHSALVVAETLA